MAGVGFSLRKLYKGDSYGEMIQLYGSAAMISSGPWLISILTLLLIGVLGWRLLPNPTLIGRFQASVTWLFAASLIVSGPLQLLFTRFIADRIYEGRLASVTSNLFGALGVTSVIAALLALAVSPLFSAESLAYRVVLGAGFVTLCNIWIVIVTLSGLKEHGQVLLSFALGYAITFVATLLLAPWGDIGLLTGFVIGQASLLFFSLSVITSMQPGAKPVAWEFLNRRKIYLGLLPIGFLYNAAIWVDKFFFWLNPLTSQPVIGPLRSSEVYDLPIFIAYLAIVPGMTVFLVRVETDFAERHTEFYNGVRTGAPLHRLESLRDGMTSAARRGIYDICKTQGLTLVLCMVFAPRLLEFFGISELHVPLFYIDAVGVSIQVLLLTVINFFFYLDQRGIVLVLTSLFFVTNTIGTWLSQRLGVEFYGCGFAISATFTCLVGLLLLNRSFAGLVRDTFMLQPLRG
jgi:uncharacterized membrane protein